MPNPQVPTSPNPLKDIPTAPMLYNAAKSPPFKISPPKKVDWNQAAAAAADPASTPEFVNPDTHIKGWTKNPEATPTG